ncbi:5-bromo-4-chloroindolyl phosphate hydrolysis family protein [Bacillus sp. PS06]|uniref:5-bromo-4-chloroindolyl phosphate hydrolysis family protein n=1 Tax=Bacillus sp. PS06 TaxID=2764176 RepID=UPI00177B6FA1|nr:5-bromo-4-chloroindolyl phosphate hydrolysis family protein [Bacillus sp. PS06]MBD8070892.1 5-bromo-4-chloroindolyl phosphate hydrolysis family protein [Bacillus sp. PS06]
MNRFITSFLQVIFTVNTTVITWLISYIGLDQAYWIATGWSLLGGVAFYGVTSAIIQARFFNKQGISRKEYRYIKGNLKEAKRKIYRLNKALISIRHIPSWKQRLDLVRMTRKIYSITKKEPKRFYRAEKFFFSHLDSAVELAEKYVFLSSQPKRNNELDQALSETRRTLESITETVEQDLYYLISNDIDQLHFELDVAKHTLKKNKDSKIIDESRKLK